MHDIIRYHRDISLEMLTDVVHSAYAQLADFGFKYWGTRQTIKDACKRVANGECYIAFRDEKIVGTILLKHPDNPVQHPLYKPLNVTSFHQLAVDPDYQRQGIGRTLMDHIEQRAKDLGLEKLICDTAEGAEHLVHMYIRRGYRIVDKVKWPKANYRSVIMRKALT